MKRRSPISKAVMDGIDWSRFSVVLLKPDCLRRGLTTDVLAAVAEHADLVIREEVRVADWQIFVHYWDLLVDKDYFTIDVVEDLRRTYVGQKVVIALVHGPAGQDTPRLLRELIGHYDPAKADPSSIRGRFGADDLATARREGRLIENLIHTSDDPQAVRRDFGTWFGANRHQLLDLPRADGRSSQ